VIKSFRENKNYGAKRLLKILPNKNWTLGGLKALIKKLTTQVYCCSTYWLVVDLALSAQYQFLLGNILSNRFAPYFLFFSQRFDQVLILSAKC